MTAVIRSSVIKPHPPPPQKPTSSTTSFSSDKTNLQLKNSRKTTVGDRNGGGSVAAAVTAATTTTCYEIRCMAESSIDPRVIFSLKEKTMKKGNREVSPAAAFSSAASLLPKGGGTTTMKQKVTNDGSAGETEAEAAVAMDGNHTNDDGDDSDDYRNHQRQQRTVMSPKEMRNHAERIISNLKSILSRRILSEVEIFESERRKRENLLKTKHSTNNNDKHTLENGAGGASSSTFSSFAFSFSSVPPFTAGGGEFSAKNESPQHNASPPFNHQHKDGMESNAANVNSNKNNGRQQQQQRSHHVLLASTVPAPQQQQRHPRPPLPPSLPPHAPKNHLIIQKQQHAKHNTFNSSSPLQPAMSFDDATAKKNGGDQSGKNNNNNDNNNNLLDGLFLIRSAAGRSKYSCGNEGKVDAADGEKATASASARLLHEVGGGIKNEKDPSFSSPTTTTDLSSTSTRTATNEDFRHGTNSNSNGNSSSFKATTQLPSKPPTPSAHGGGGIRNTSSFSSSSSPSSSFQKRRQKYLSVLQQANAKHKSQEQQQEEEQQGATSSATVFKSNHLEYSGEGGDDGSSAGANIRNDCNNNNKSAKQQSEVLEARITEILYFDREFAQMCLLTAPALSGILSEQLAFEAEKSIIAQRDGKDGAKAEVNASSSAPLVCCTIDSLKQRWVRSTGGGDADVKTQKAKEGEKMREAEDEELNNLIIRLLIAIGIFDLRITYDILKYNTVAATAASSGGDPAIDATDDDEASNLHQKTITDDADEDDAQEEKVIRLHLDAEGNVMTAELIQPIPTDVTREEEEEGEEEEEEEESKEGDEKEGKSTTASGQVEISDEDRNGGVEASVSNAVGKSSSSSFYAPIFVSKSQQRIPLGKRSLRTAPSTAGDRSDDAIRDRVFDEITNVKEIFEEEEMKNSPKGTRSKDDDNVIPKHPHNETDANDAISNPQLGMNPKNLLTEDEEMEGITALQEFNRSSQTKRGGSPTSPPHTPKISTETGFHVATGTSTVAGSRVVFYGKMRPNSSRKERGGGAEDDDDDNGGSAQKKQQTAAASGSQAKKKQTGVIDDAASPPQLPQQPPSSSSPSAVVSATTAATAASLLKTTQIHSQNDDDIEEDNDESDDGDDDAASPSFSTRKPTVSLVRKRTLPNLSPPKEGLGDFSASFSPTDRDQKSKQSNATIVGAAAHVGIGFSTDNSRVESDVTTTATTTTTTFLSPPPPPPLHAIISTAPASRTTSDRVTFRQNTNTTISLTAAGNRKSGDGDTDEANVDHTHHDLGRITRTASLPFPSTTTSSSDKDPSTPFSFGKASAAFLATAERRLSTMSTNSVNTTGTGTDGGVSNDSFSTPPAFSRNVRRETIAPNAIPMPPTVASLKFEADDAASPSESEEKESNANVTSEQNGNDDDKKARLTTAQLNNGKPLSLMEALAAGNHLTVSDEFFQRTQGDRGGEREVGAANDENSNNETTTNDVAKVEKDAVADPNNPHGGDRSKRRNFNISFVEEEGEDDKDEHNNNQTKDEEKEKRASAKEEISQTPASDNNNGNHHNDDESHSTSHLNNTLSRSRRNLKAQPSVILRVAISSHFRPVTPSEMSLRQPIIVKPNIINNNNNNAAANFGGQPCLEESMEVPDEVREIREMWRKAEEEEHAEAEMLKKIVPWQIPLDRPRVDNYALAESSFFKSFLERRAHTNQKSTVGEGGVAEMTQRRRKNQATTSNNSNFILVASNNADHLQHHHAEDEALEKQEATTPREEGGAMTENTSQNLKNSDIDDDPSVITTIVGDLVGSSAQQQQQHNGSASSDDFNTNINEAMMLSSFDQNPIPSLCSPTTGANINTGKANNAIESLPNMATSASSSFAGTVGGSLEGGQQQQPLSSSNNNNKSNPFTAGYQHPAQSRSSSELSFVSRMWRAGGHTGLVRRSSALSIETRSTSRVSFSSASYSPLSIPQST